MTKLAVIAVVFATGCAVEAAEPAAAEPDAAPQDAPDAPTPRPDVPAVDSGSPDTAPATDSAPEVEACAPDPNVCGHTCASTDGCGFPMHCTTCFGGCPVKVGDGVVCPSTENQVQCPTGTPTSSACTLAARDASSEFWCCPE